MFMGGGSGEGDGSAGSSQGGGGIPPKGDGGGTSGDGSSGEQSKINYPSDLEQSYHGNPTLLKHYDKEKGEFRIGTMMKSLIHASSAIGKEKVLKPDKNWTDDQWNTFYRDIGLPDSVDKYDIKNNLAKGLEANEKMFNGFKEIAYKSGILPKQAQAVVDYFNQTIAETVQEQSKTASLNLQQARLDLEREYGNAFERKMNVAEQGIKAFASAEMMDSLEKKGFMDDPDFTRLMVKIGEALGEDKFNDDVKKSGQMTPSEIDAEIESFYKKDHPFSNSGHPHHDQYVNRMMELQELKLKQRGIANRVITEYAGR